MLNTDSASSDPAGLLRAELQAACAGQEQTLYALLDGARIPKLARMLRELKVEHVPLFRTSPKENIIDVTPFMARAMPSEDMPVWMILQPEVLQAAVFLVCDAQPEQIHQHLRRFLLVRDSLQRSVYVRFYDPRVLGPFLAVSNDLERRRFFGPVRKFFAHSSDEPGKFREWSLTEAEQAIPIPPAPDTHHPFLLRKEHDDEFGRVAMESYDRRCIDYLRERYPDRLKDAPEERVLGLVNEAKELGPKMGLTGARDITHLSELLLLGITDEMKQRIARTPEKDRSVESLKLRDQLAAGASA